MSRLSIQARMTLWYTTLMAVLALAVLLVLSFVGDSVVRETAHQQLMQRVEDASGSIVQTEQGFDVSKEEPYYSQGVYLLFYDDEYRFLDGSWPASFPDAVVAMDGAFRILGDYYVYDRHVPFGEQGVWIRGISESGSASATYASLMRLLTIALPLPVVLSGFGGRLIARRAFSTVTQLCAQADSISSGNDLSRRLSTGEGRDELHRLAATMDRMLERLERAFRSEQQFTSDVAHELRTPISVILAECEFSLSMPHDDEDRETLEAIQRQAQRMARMTEELLALSRMELGRTAFRPTEIDLAELAEGVCEEQARLLPEGTLRCETEPVRAYVDRDMLVRVLINLLSNAARFGGTHITVKTGLCEVGCFLSVRDNGIGMTEEVRTRVFDRFYQADPARSDRENKGMGLGLSMVSEIVRLHGGSISVESEPGQGSTFTVTLPTGLEEEV